MPAFDICSQSGSVESWLATQPEDYEPSLGSDRKRLFRHQHIDSTKRCCLREIEPNSVSMDPPKKHQRASPDKKKKRDVGILRSPFPVRSRTRQRSDEAVFEDNDQENDQTPRPKTLSLKSLPKLDARKSMRKRAARTVDLPRIQRQPPPVANDRHHRAKLARD